MPRRIRRGVKGRLLACVRRALRTGVLLALAAFALQWSFAQGNEQEGNEDEEAAVPLERSPAEQSTASPDEPPLAEDAMLPRDAPPPDAPPAPAPDEPPPRRASALSPDVPSSTMESASSPDEPPPTRQVAPPPAAPEPASSSQAATPSLEPPSSTDALPPAEDAQVPQDPEGPRQEDTAQEDAGQEPPTAEERRMAREAKQEERRANKEAIKVARAKIKAARKERRQKDRDRKQRQKEEKDLDKPARLVAFAPEVRIRSIWNAQIGTGLSKHYGRIAPAILADRVIIADAYGLVEARDRFDGKRLWQVRVGKKKRTSLLATSDRSSLTGGVGVGEGMVLIGTTRGEVIALDASDGVELWRVVLSSEILAPPVAGDGVVVAHTGDGRIVALEPEDGTTRWTYDIQVPILSLRGTATPKIMAGRVYAAFSTGMVAAIDVESGAPVWEQRIMLPEGRSELERIVDIDGNPVVLADATFAASYQGQLKAMHTSNGVVVWERQASTHLDLAVGYSQVYVVSDDDIITAVNQMDASTAWEYEGLFNRRLTSPLVYDNYVLIGDDKGYLHALAQSDGRLVGRLKFSGGLRSSMAEADDIIYVYSSKGRLNALEIKRIE